MAAPSPEPARVVEGGRIFVLGWPWLEVTCDGTGGLTFRGRGLAWLLVGEVRIPREEITLACRAKSSSRTYAFQSLALRTVNGEAFLLEFVESRQIDTVLDHLAEHGVPVQRDVWTYRSMGGIMLTPPVAEGS